MTNLNHPISPTFSERKLSAQTSLHSPTSPINLVSPPKQLKPNHLPPFPDVVRTHRLPLAMKIRGDTVQVYLHSFPRIEPDGVFVYDIEFDDGSIQESVCRNSIFIPSSTAYQMLILQESQTSVKTPTRQDRRKRKRRCDRDV